MRTTPVSVVPYPSRRGNSRQDSTNRFSSGESGALPHDTSRTRSPRRRSRRSSFTVVSRAPVPVNSPTRATNSLWYSWKSMSQMRGTSSSWVGRASPRTGTTCRSSWCSRRCSRVPACCRAVRDPPHASGGGSSWWGRALPVPGTSPPRSAGACARPWRGSRPRSGGRPPVPARRHHPAPHGGDVTACRRSGPAVDTPAAGTGSSAGPATGGAGGEGQVRSASTAGWSGRCRSTGRAWCRRRSPLPRRRGTVPTGCW